MHNTYRVILKEQVTPLILDIEEEGEDQDDVDHGDEAHDDQATVHHGNCFHHKQEVNIMLDCFWNIINNIYNRNKKK